MLISYKYEYIFIHNYKVAGASVKNALSQYSLDSPPNNHFINKYILEKSDLLRSYVPKIANKYVPLITFNHHGTCQSLKKQIGEEIWNQFFKFAFVRNPWDWQVSIYHYILPRKNHPQHKIVKGFENFNEYIEWRVKHNLNPQKDIICDKDGKIMVDFLGKLENIHDDFDHICKQMGFDVKLPHLNKSKHKDYRQYYNEHSKKLIEDSFKEDIELFDYEF